MLFAVLSAGVISVIAKTVEICSGSVPITCLLYTSKVTERKISIDELAKAYDDGKLEEAFGTGTAAVISPIGHLNWGDKKIMEINNGKIGEVSQRLYDTLTGIQWGKIKDTFGWTVEVK